MLCLQGLFVHVVSYMSAAFSWVLGRSPGLCTLYSYTFQSSSFWCFKFFFNCLGRAFGKDMVQNSQNQRRFLLEYSTAWDQILDLIFIPFYFVALKDVMSYFPTLICWIFFFPYSAVYRIYSATGLLDPVGEALPSNASFCTDPWMNRLFPPPPFFVFLVQHPLVPTYVPQASFVLPGLTEFSDVGACSKGCGLTLAKLFLCCRLLWYRQVCPVCNCTWDGCVFWRLWLVEQGDGLALAMQLWV